jgi:hypothetical protein
MLGRDPEYWRTQLHSAHLPVRLFALRIIRQMGSQGARMLLEAKVELPEWPLVWALQGCATPALLRSAAAHSAQRLALTLQRRTPRARGKLARHNLDACLQGLRQANNPHQRLSWMMVLLEQHGEAACTDLLGIIATPTAPRAQWEQLAALSAWALGQLGRSVLLEISERFRQSAPAVQVWLCQVLWYLGPLAQGSESFVGSTPGVWPSAALYSLEGAGTRALILRKEAPVWVDKSSLGRLAELVHSTSREERLYAACALPGWGPALPRVARLLEALCHDADHSLRDIAWRGLEQLGGVTSPQALRAGLQSQDGEIRRAALVCFRDNYGVDPVEVLRRNIHDPELSLLAVLAIQEGGLPPGQLLPALEFASRLHGVQLLVMLSALAQAPAPSPEEPIDLADLARSSQIDVRLAVARLLMAWKRSPEELIPFADDADLPLSHQVTEYLIDLGHPDSLAPLLVEGPRLTRRLSLMDARSVLARMLRLGPSRGQLAPLLDRLRELTQHRDVEVSRSATRILKGQNLDTLIWADFESLDPALQQSLTSLIRETGSLPDGLRAALLEGLYISPSTLSLAVDLLPAESVSTLLWSMFIRSPRLNRHHFLEPFLKLAQSGFSLLLELIAHQEPEVSEDAVTLLLRWIERAGKEELRDLSLLRTPLSASARRSLAIGLAEALLAPHQPLESVWLDWALALSRQLEFRAANLALQALGRYHVRGQQDEPERALQGILRACNHPQRSVRLEAVAQLRALQLSDVQRWQVAVTLRLLWLQEADELTSYEIHLGQSMLEDCEDPEVLQEISLLLD